ncbi:hypothetical protein FPV67DRAFT_1766010 [Lyophyllum atratum]|nr:hypothetical protein FPV67DRAFT_1766010 [Lyophyllum atratum]
MKGETENLETLGETSTAPTIPGPLSMKLGGKTTASEVWEAPVGDVTRQSRRGSVDDWICSTGCSKSSASRKATWEFTSRRYVWTITVRSTSTVRERGGKEARIEGRTAEGFDGRKSGQYQTDRCAVGGGKERVRTEADGLRQGHGRQRWRMRKWYGSASLSCQGLSDLMFENSESGRERQKWTRVALTRVVARAVGSGEGGNGRVPALQLMNLLGSRDEDTTPDDDAYTSTFGPAGPNVVLVYEMVVLIGFLFCIVDPTRRSFVRTCTPGLGQGQRISNRKRAKQVLQLRGFGYGESNPELPRLGHNLTLLGMRGGNFYDQYSLSQQLAGKKGPAQAAFAPSSDPIKLLPPSRLPSLQLLSKPPPLVPIIHARGR